MIQTVQAAVTAVDLQAGFALTRTIDQVHGQRSLWGDGVLGDLA
jgi:hypothetical protein